MDATPSQIAKFLLPQTPAILKTSLLHGIGVSRNSSKWDLRTALTVSVVRDMVNPNKSGKPAASVTQVQWLTCGDAGVKGKVWICKTAWGARRGGSEGEGEQVAIEGKDEEEDTARECVCKAVREMGQDAKWTVPESKSVEGEWTGYRAAMGDEQPEPDEGLSEHDKYQRMLGETTSKVTVLYLHGGAMHLMDPATYRKLTGRLARETGGRVFSVRYRLSPQNPFPAALVDALTAYLGLLHPPPGVPHKPIPANEILFAGDSAGGLLCSALLQLLLQLRRSSESSTIRWHGADIPIVLPAGLALTSPWCDVSCSLPSYESNAHYDYLPPPSQSRSMKRTPCAAWPDPPPRSDLYCEDSALEHPLVSTLAAQDWTGAPPVFFSVGEEMLRDEAAVLARRMARQGVSVRWRGFEAMPHVFSMMVPHLRQTGVHWAEMGGFCNEVVEGKAVRSHAQTVLVKRLERMEVRFDELTGVTDEQAVEFMARARRIIEKKEGEATEGKPML